MDGVQSVERSFAILRVIASEPSGLSTIARRTGLPKSTVARLVATLEAERAVERNGDLYSIGSGIATLAGATGTLERLIAAVRPELRRLVSITHESAGMGVPEGRVVRYVVQLDSDKPVHVRNWAGTVAPMHTAASGLSMLAAAEEASVHAYLSRDLERKTANTMVDADAIRDRLRTVRETGYAWGNEEFVEGINSVAAAITNEGGEAVGAIDIFGPSFRFPPAGDRVRLGELVSDAAAAVSERLRSPTL